MADKVVADAAAGQVEENRETFENYAMYKASKTFAKATSKYNLGHGVAKRLDGLGKRHKDNKWYQRFPNEFEEDDDSDENGVVENYDLLIVLGKIITVM